MTPECCKNCEEKNGCDKPICSCARWRAWFSEVWAALQADAKKAIEYREQIKREAQEKCPTETRSEPKSSDA